MKINLKINDLEKIRKIITHQNCPDGIASAMILKAVLPEAEVLFVQYGTPEHRELKAEPGLLFCDMTPPPERVSDFVKAKSIVLDHHKGAEPIVAQFEDRGVFADEKKQPGVSGALLAYGVYRIMTHLLKGHSEKVERFASLVGVRDTWQTKSPDWKQACAISTALHLLGAEILLKKNSLPYLTLDQIEIGEMLEIRKARKVEEQAKALYCFISLCGLVATFNDPDKLTSDVAQKIRETRPEISLVAGFFYKVESDEVMNIVFSLRSCQDSVDVSKIARTHGGNGHTQAAGFSLPVVDGQQHPASLLRWCLEVVR